RIRAGGSTGASEARPLAASGAAPRVGRLKLDTGIESSISPIPNSLNSDSSALSSQMTRLSGSTPRARVNGVQLHPTSLPGGRLGAEAFAFVDWLAAAGQTYWQTLPLGPTGEGGSPYKSPSAFAGSAELLAEPDAPVSAAEIEALREREAYWL